MCFGATARHDDTGFFEQQRRNTRLCEAHLLRFVVQILQQRQYPFAHVQPKLQVGSRFLGSFDF